MNVKVAESNAWRQHKKATNKSGRGKVEGGRWQIRSAYKKYWFVLVLCDIYGRGDVIVIAGYCHQLFGGQ